MYDDDDDDDDDDDSTILLQTQVPHWVLRVYTLLHKYTGDQSGTSRVAEHSLHSQ